MDVCGYVGIVAVFPWRLKLGFAVREVERVASCLPGGVNTCVNGGERLGLGVGLRRRLFRGHHHIDTSPPLAALYDSFMYRCAMATASLSTCNDRALRGLTNYAP